MDMEHNVKSKVIQTTAKKGLQLMLLRIKPLIWLEFFSCSLRNSGGKKITFLLSKNSHKICEVCYWGGRDPLYSSKIRRCKVYDFFRKVFFNIV